MALCYFASNYPQATYHTHHHTSRLYDHQGHPISRSREAFNFLNVSITKAQVGTPRCSRGEFDIRGEGARIPSRVKYMYKIDHCWDLQAPLPMPPFYFAIHLKETKRATRARERGWTSPYPNLCFTHTRARLHRLILQLKRTLLSKKMPIIFGEGDMIFNLFPPPRARELSEGY